MVTTSNRSFYECKMDDLDGILDARIATMKQHDSEDALVSEIHPCIKFRRNSVNLVIGRRGSGKTYFVLRELLKLFELDKEKGFGFTRIFYITDKASDDTVALLSRAFPPGIFVQHFVPTDNAYDLMCEIDRIKHRVREYEQNPLACDRKVYDKDMNVLTPIVLPRGMMPQTVFIFDDCIGLFRKDSKLAKKCYENRQMRATIFMMLQDVQGISPSMKSNINSLTLFGQFPKTKWNTLTYQLPSLPVTYDNYALLKATDGFFIDFEEDGEAELISREQCRAICDYT